MSTSHISISDRVAEERGNTEGEGGKREERKRGSGEEWRGEVSYKREERTGKEVGVERRGEQDERTEGDQERRREKERRDESEDGRREERGCVIRG